jgi:hypothetical protein
MSFSSRFRLALTLGLTVFLTAVAPPVRTAPPHGLPKILSVSISAHDFRPGDAVTGRVETSPNVGYVEARIDNYNQALTRDAVGKFSLRYTIPLYLAVMPWLKHEWTLQFIARSVDGVEVKRRMPITLH